MKRPMDIMFSCLALLILSPVLLATAAAVLVDSGRPVFYRQTRVGRGGQAFGMYKFRSMAANAAAIGPFYTASDDPRITRVGRWIRRTSLDELPQLLNVLAGDMSLVGPRPDVPAQRSLYSDADWALRCSVRPGITGLAQVKLRSEGTEDQRRELDSALRAGVRRLARPAHPFLDLGTPHRQGKQLAMCGIFGYWDCARRALPPERLSAMGERLVHRGPDDQGLRHQPERAVAVGNRRLSIIDLAGGHQPFVSDDGAIALVQNGEIFNYVELAAELRAQGVHLATHSDTEVLLRLYEREGPGFVRRLNGMFAIAIDDAREDSLLLVRDRIGVKPLYVARQGTRCLFASEIKAILEGLERRPELDLEAIHHYLSFNYIPAPWTIWQDIRHVMPGCWMKFTRRGCGAGPLVAPCGAAGTRLALRGLVRRIPCHPRRRDATSACAPTCPGAPSSRAASIPARSSP